MITKQKFSYLIPFAAILCVISAGCGGSSSSSGSPLPSGNRAAIAASIKGASSSSTAIKEGSPDRARTKADRQTISPVLPGRPGVARPADAAKVARLDEGDITVGSPIAVSDDLWGKVTAVEYAEVRGFRDIALLKFDIFDDAAHTSLVGYQNTKNRTVGAETTNTLESKFTKGKYAPRDLSSSSIFNFETGRIFQQSVDSGREEIAPGEFRDYRYSTRWETLGFGQPFTFSSESQQGGVQFSTSGTYYFDGRLEMVWVNTAGYTIRWTSNADGSGEFQLENTNDPLCPATGTYGIDGKGTITFVDGTKADFDLYDNAFWR